MAEENKHPPTTEEQTPPEMPGKAPEKEQAEIPDVGAGPAPSAKVIDLSAVRSTPEKDAPTDIPKEPEAQPVSVTEYSKQEWKKPMPEPEKTKPKRGRPAKSEKAAPTEPGAKKEAKAEKPRRGRPSKAEKAAPEQTKPPKAGKTHAAPEEKAAPPAPEVPPTPRDATRAEKEEIVYLLSDHSFSVYVNRPGLSFGYFFRGGGTLSGIQRGIVEFTVEGYNERAFISMNQQQVQQLEIDDGNTIQVVDIDRNKPFAIVLPINAGNITFYDVNRNTVEYWNNPL